MHIFDGFTHARLVNALNLPLSRFHKMHWMIGFVAKIRWWKLRLRGGTLEFAILIGWPSKKIAVSDLNANTNPVWMTRWSSSLLNISCELQTVWEKQATLYFVFLARISSINQAFSISCGSLKIFGLPITRWTWVRFIVWLPISQALSDEIPCRKCCSEQTRISENNLKMTRHYNKSLEIQGKEKNLSCPL